MRAFRWIWLTLWLPGIASRGAREVASVGWYQQQENTPRPGSYWTTRAHRQWHLLLHVAGPAGADDECPGFARPRPYAPMLLTVNMLCSRYQTAARLLTMLPDATRPYATHATRIMLPDHAAKPSCRTMLPDCAPNHAAKPSCQTMLSPCCQTVSLNIP